MFTITKDFAFSASHVLTNLPAGHQCARLHGHNYVVRVELAAAVLDEQGMVVDYAELDPLKKWIDECLDHRHLNDVLGTETPTAEVLAWTIAAQVPTLHPATLAGVGVSETPKTWAWWRP